MELQWWPTKADQLLAWSQDICLYKIEDADQVDIQIKPNYLKLSDKKHAYLEAKITEYPYPKIVDTYPSSEDEIIAIASGTGKVTLTSFAAKNISKEFIPKHSRQINALAWNKYSPNLLASALDKVKARSDYSVCIWDIGSSGKLMNGFLSDSLRPAVEFGVGETAHSIAWAQSKVILVGLNGKHIKLFDLRMDGQPKLGSTASTKAVNGLTIDGSHKVASYAENQVFVFDMRNFDKPFVVLNHSKNISKILWCPTRSGLLACLEKDSTYITLQDVHHASISSEEGEPVVLERKLSPSFDTTAGSTPIYSFAWHPTEENLITTSSPSGTLWNSTVYERITLNWSPTSKLCWSNGKKVMQFIDNNDQIYAHLDDISIKMRNRALVAYGLKNSFKENAKVVEDDKNLKTLWEWLDYCKLLTDKERYRLPYLGTIKYPGARAILRMDKLTDGINWPLASTVVTNNSFDLQHNKTYKSDERNFVQTLCGWGSEENGTSPTRKAAISLFHLKLRQAIRILSDSGHTIIAVAIAGFSEDRNSLWREMAQSNSCNLDDPYVRAIFSFLTESDNNYETILTDTGLSVVDRVGFACSFLPDNKLLNFIQELTNEMVKTGNLDGVILTGMTPSCLPLFQNYLDITGDVQTVSMLAIRTMASDIPSCLQLKMWIEQYRELLDAWKLWTERAEFDIIKSKNNTSLVPPPEITISCNFCGKNISQSLVRNTQLFSRFTTTNARIKLSCCPSCRKPLPRCAICLLHMGTILGSGSNITSNSTTTTTSSSSAVVPTPPKNPAKNTGASSEALSWYTWCLGCKHGGHTVHLQLWFEHQNECPVSHCKCKCCTLDKVADFT